MKTLRPVIVDTNVLFSALLSSSSHFADMLLQSGHRFFVCEQVLVELFNLDYSQVLDDAPPCFRFFLRSNVLKPEIQNTLPHKSERGF